MTFSGITGDAPTGESLFTLITETDPYQDWAQFPGLEDVFESAPPHGPMARAFINAQVEEALISFSGQLPDGAIIVKDSFGESESDETEGLTVMWKVKGFDPDNNDWFWANFSRDGEVKVEGKVGSCVACHGSARGNDFVYLHQF